MPNGPNNIPSPTMTARPPIMFSGMAWNAPATSTMAVMMTGTINGTPSRLARRIRVGRSGRVFRLHEGFLEVFWAASAAR